MVKKYSLRKLFLTDPLFCKIERNENEKMDKEGLTSKITKKVNEI